MVNKRLQTWLPLLLSLAVIFGIFLGFKMRDNFPSKNFFSRDRSNSLQEVLNLINDKYVDTVNLKSISDSAILSVLAKLDPHSVYIPAKDLEQINDEIRGSFYGVGIEFSMFSDTLNVTNVLKDGPAFKAGLIIGDKILKVNDSLISGVKRSTDGIRELLHGQRGSKLDIAVLRGNQSKHFNVIRDVIPLSSIDAAYMIDSATGFIRINKFASTTYKEFMEALTRLKGLKMQNLVLDLRDNGGGVLEEAIEIADEFLDGDKLITYTEGAHIPRKEYRSRRSGQFESGKLVVLADEGTASASEVLLGALQDWNRATILGRRTFGKGLVQEQYNLSDKSALRLTVARYYTPVGRSIQRSYAAGNQAYFDDISRRFQHGEMQYSDSVRFDSSKRYTTPSGKIVFGGGGITPDVFVSEDTNRIGYYSAILYSKGLFDNYGYKYYLANPGLADKYRSADAFIKNFRLSEQDWNNFAGLAAKDSVELSHISEAEKKGIKTVLRTSIARQLFRSEGYFESVNEEDSTLLKALEIIKTKN